MGVNYRGEIQIVRGPNEKAHPVVNMASARFHRLLGDSSLGMHTKCMQKWCTSDRASCSTSGRPTSDFLTQGPAIAEFESIFKGNTRNDEYFSAYMTLSEEARVVDANGKEIYRGNDPGKPGEPGPCAPPRTQP